MRANQRCERLGHRISKLLQELAALRKLRIRVVV
jgi:hypothetical protein